jgi:hypothetical protein
MKKSACRWPRRLAHEAPGGAMDDLARDEAQVRVVDALLLPEAGKDQGLDVAERAHHAALA